MIPKGWYLTNLYKVCDGNLQTGPFGSQLKANEYASDGISVFMPKDLLKCRAKSTFAAKITQERAATLRKHMLEEGDLIFSRRGDVSRFALITKETADNICGTGCLRARPSKEHASSYLSYLLQKTSTKIWLEKNSVGLTMPNMNTKIIGKLPLLLAKSKKEQQKIAKILTTWSQAINATECLIANSQKQKKALVQKFLVDKKQKSDNLSVWKERRLEEIFSFKKGSGLSKSTILDKAKNKCILYGELYTHYDEVVLKVKSFTNLCDGMLSSTGDILIPCSTTTSGIDLANATALMEDNVLLGGDINVLRPKTNDVDSSFIAHLLTHIKKGSSPVCVRL